jgi:hypothetical protein
MQLIPAIDEDLNNNHKPIKKENPRFDFFCSI